MLPYGRLAPFLTKILDAAHGIKLILNKHMRLSSVIEYSQKQESNMILRGWMLLMKLHILVLLKSSNNFD
jgi:hypothetical protein